MGLFENVFKNVASKTNKKSIDRVTENGKSMLIFYFDKVTIKLESTKVNSNEEIVYLETFYPTYGRYGYEVEDFVDDIIRLEKYVKNNPGENAIYDALDLFTKDNINQFNRIVDTDLYSNIALFVLYLTTFSAMHGETTDNLEKKNLSETFAYREFNLFRDNIYVTKYRYENGQTVPYLEKYN